MSFPSEKMPVKYDRSIIQREIENIHQELGDAKSVQNARLDTIENTVDGMIAEDAIVGEGVRGNHAPLPVPTNIAVGQVPLTNIFIITCDPIDIAKHPNVQGYQFFASTEKDFSPLVEATQGKHLTPPEDPTTPADKPL